MNKKYKISEAASGAEYFGGTQSGIKYPLESYHKNKNIRVFFTAELFEILEILQEEGNYIAYELLWLDDPSSTYRNTLGISRVNVSKDISCFDVTIGRHTNSMKIRNFLNYYWGRSYFQVKAVDEFINDYNILAGGKEVAPKVKVEVPAFKFNPKDVRSTFISLVTKTYPYGHESEVLKFLPSLQKDKVNNYYHIIGDNPTSMFCCHLDTADRIQSNVNLFTLKDDKGDEIIYTDGVTILGADDKAGVTVLLYMMAHNIPGVYYFFIGEERGAIGSSALSSIYEDIPYLKNIKRCVAFDRRDVFSIITSQLGKVCCSKDFADALAVELKKGGLSYKADPTGVFTDSASFLEDIPECTNLSCGYYSEHSGKERQNISFLERLCKASVMVNWESLPTARKVGISEEVKRKYKTLIKDLQSYPFRIGVKLTAEDDGSTAIMCDLEDGIIGDTYDTLEMLQYLLKRHKIDQTAYFDGEYIKIYLP